MPLIVSIYHLHIAIVKIKPKECVLVVYFALMQINCVTDGSYCYLIRMVYESWIINWSSVKLFRRYCSYVSLVKFLKQQTRIYTVTLRIAHRQVYKHALFPLLLSRIYSWNHARTIPTPTTTKQQSPHSCCICVAIRWIAFGPI